MSAQIKSYADPEKLYRYRPLKKPDQEILAIENAYVWCAAYSTLNDPMEGAYSSSEPLKKSADYKQVRREIRNKKSVIGISSFSESHDLELMWAHYADQFRGICIEYNMYDLLRKLPDGAEFVRMHYDEKGPIVRRSKKPVEELAKKVFSVKSYRWQYEREWRLFDQLGAVSYQSAKCVTKVYLGSRISNKNRGAVTRVLGNLGIPWQEMSIKQYSITFSDSAE